QPPIAFSATENVAWKQPLPGRGVSGPIVIKDRVVVTASSGPVKEDKLHVLCFDAESGKQLWHRQFWATGRPYHHPTSSNAAPTPASDGERIFAFYSSNDLVCLDLDGNLLWYRGLAFDWPKAGNDVGMSSSPLVIGDTVVVQVENQGDSFAAGLDTATGETRWRVSRPNKANWVSPAAFRGNSGKDAVLLQSGDGLTAYDAKSGEQLWKYDVACAGIPSVTAAGDRIYLPANGLTALDVAAGSTSPSLAWDSNRLSPGNASPVVLGDRVYLLAKAGVLNCGDAATGDLLWQERLKGTFWATPVIANGHAYCVNQDGQCLVVNLAGEKGEVVHTAEIGEGFFGTPAVAGNGLYLRGEKHLWKIAEPKP
ncbi:MAG TPA: PQQ-binding-like beta-propeller repeat protein, partial [Pirellulaceae bacterium]|nr:PQQ-binding-like beta-propeller repeat protein [Pirellulaceae bacterium]